MSFAALRQQYLDNNPCVTLPPMVNNLGELKQFLDEWVEQNKHFHPKIVVADGNPPLSYVGFRAFYIDEGGQEHSVTKAVPLENTLDRIYFIERGKIGDKLMELREHFDKITTYHEKFRKEYIPVKDDGTVDLPPGKQI